MGASNSNLFGAYVFLQILQKNYEFYFLEIPVNAGNTAAAPALLLSEALKLFVATAYLFLESHNSKEMLRKRLQGRKMEEIFAFAIPAALGVISNCIYFAAARSTSSSLLQTWMMTTIPLTAIFHHIWIEKQRNKYVWSTTLYMYIFVVMLEMPLTAWLGLSGWIAANYCARYTYCIVELCCQYHNRETY
jgi:UDP-sugar transporter A1/2/3